MVHFSPYTFKTFIFVSLLLTLVYFDSYKKTSRQEDRESREVRHIHLCHYENEHFES